MNTDIKYQEEVVKKDPKYKSFKEYYSNPEFKAKHDLYVREKIQCPECTKFVQRVAMAKHKKSRKHIDCCKNDKKIIDDDLYKLAMDLIESHKNKK